MAPYCFTELTGKKNSYSYHLSQVLPSDMAYEAAYRGDRGGHYEKPGYIHATTNPLGFPLSSLLHERHASSALFDKVSTPHANIGRYIADTGLEVALVTAADNRGGDTRVGYIALDRTAKIEGYQGRIDSIVRPVLDFVLDPNFVKKLEQVEAVTRDVASIALDNWELGEASLYLPSLRIKGPKPQTNRGWSRRLSRDRDQLRVDQDVIGAPTVNGRQIFGSLITVFLNR